MSLFSLTIYQVHEETIAKAFVSKQPRRRHCFEVCFLNALLWSSMCSKRNLMYFFPLFLQCVNFPFLIACLPIAMTLLVQLYYMAPYSLFVIYLFIYYMKLNRDVLKTLDNKRRCGVFELSPDYRPSVLQVWIILNLQYCFIADLTSILLNTQRVLPSEKGFS